MELEATIVTRARDLGRALAAEGDLADTFAFAEELSPCARELGSDSTAYLRTLMSLGAGDLSVARVVEPHLDALAILSQAGIAADGGVWGVYAAHGPGHRLEAVADGGRWSLSGTKPWCSLAGEIAHAVVTAHTSATTTRAFAVSLRHPGVTHPRQPWVPRGLSRIRSTTTQFAQVPAEAVGDGEWYLRRPGFAWGGIGVAAVWLGAAHALLQTLADSAGRREPDQIALMHLGRADITVHAATLALGDAARAIDAGEATGRAGPVLADRVRSICAATLEKLVTITGHALGPAPLTADDEHARRIADATVYVRQHHAERDLARLGGALLDSRA